MWERFFNWQSDMDWAWGPLLRLRPARSEPIRPWVWVRLFVAMTLLGVLLLGLLVAADVFGMRWAKSKRVPLPPAVAEAQATVAAMASDRDTQVLLLGLLVGLPPLFFALCLPYHWAWNQRAARVRIVGVGKEAGKKGEEPAEADVWPPPIRPR